MNEERRPARRLPDLNITAADCTKRPGRRGWDHPEDLSDDELMLVVRSTAAVDRAVDGFRKEAAT
jgi:hypothetical protein